MSQNLTNSHPSQQQQKPQQRHVLFWPLLHSHRNKNHKQDGYCFEKEGLLMGWELQQSYSNLYTTHVTIVAFLLPFSAKIVAPTATRIKAERDNLFSIKKEEIDSVMKRFHSALNPPHDSLFSSSLQIVGIWNPKNYLRDDTHRNLGNILSYPTIGPSANGPRWFNCDDASCSKKALDEITYYAPNQNYQLKSEHIATTTTTLLCQILQHISQVPFIYAKFYSILSSSSSSSYSNSRATSKSTSISTPTSSHEPPTLNETNSRTDSLPPSHINSSSTNSHSPFYYISLVQNRLRSSSLTWIHLTHRYQLLFPNTFRPFYTFIPLSCILIWKYISCSITTANTPSPPLLLNHLKSSVGTYETNSFPMANLLVDQVMGIVMAAILLYPSFTTYFLSTSSLSSSRISVPFSYSDIPNMYHPFVKQCMTWLETFPVGFKLNVKLTQHMGREIYMIVTFHSHIVQTLISWLSLPSLSFHHMMGIICGCYGVSTCISVMFDVGHLLTLHLQIIRYVFGRMIQIQTSTLSSLWLLFCGKKQNILRGRTDTAFQYSSHYDYMQLLIGMILFSIGLFLYTTFGVYHFFFSSVICIVQGIGLVGLGGGICFMGWTCFPMDAVVRQCLYGNKEDYGTHVWFQEVSSIPPSISTAIFNEDKVHHPHNNKTNEIPPCPRQNILQIQKSSLVSIIINAYQPYLTMYFRQIPTFVLELWTGRPSSMISKFLEMNIKCLTEGGAEMAGN